MIVYAEISIPRVASTLFLTHSAILNLFILLLLRGLRSVCLVLLRFALSSLAPLRRLVEYALEVIHKVLRSAVWLPFRIPSL
jgi:hypothetical protein